MAAVNVITNAQLQSIKEKITPPQSTDKSKYLLALHEKSRIRAEGWPNTLEAQRYRKDRARKERLAALEAVRQQQDRVVAEDKERGRRATLERVNKMIFHETDSAKGFHSAALHCDVLAERTAQVEFKQQIATLRSAQDEAFNRQMREQVELAEDAEVAKLMEARDRALEQKAAQLQQLEDVKARILADRAANRIEGEELKAKAQAEMKADQDRAADARARAQAVKEESAQANEALKEYKRQQEKVAAEQEVARIAYLERKDRLAVEHKERAAAIAAEKEARRKAMVEIMEGKFKEFMSNEAGRLDRDVKHAEEKSAAEEELRAAQRRAEWRAICQSRDQQLNSKKTQRMAALEADKAFAAAWKERMQQLVEEELAEAEARRSRNRHVAAFQKHQKALKAKRKGAAKHAALQEAAMIQELTADKGKRFEKYAREFIEEYQRQGKPIKPMQIVMNKPAPLDSA